MTVVSTLPSPRSQGPWRALVFCLHPISRIFVFQCSGWSSTRIICVHCASPDAPIERIVSEKGHWTKATSWQNFMLWILSFFCLICPKLSDCCVMFGKGLHNFYCLSDEIVYPWSQQRTVTRLREGLGWARRRSAGENLGAIQSIEKVSASATVTSSSSWEEFTFTEMTGV